MLKGNPLYAHLFLTALASKEGIGTLEGYQRRRLGDIPFKVLTQMIDHPLTTAGLARFTQDWESATKQ